MPRWGRAFLNKSPSRNEVRGLLAAAAEGGAFTLLDGGNLPAAASLTVTDLSDRFSQIVVHLAGVSSDTATRQPLVQVSTDNGATFDTTAANYPGFRVTGSTVAAKAAASLVEAADQAAAATTTVTIVLSAYQGLGYAQYQAYSTSGGYSTMGSYVGSTDPINALKILWNGSGNFDAGTYAVYGVS
jgi:hypothetical protein